MATKEERAIIAAAEAVRTGSVFVRRAVAAATEEDDKGPRDYRYERKVVDKGWLKVVRYTGESKLRLNVTAYAFGHKLHFTVKRDV
jgi:hypothetical protein